MRTHPARRDRWIIWLRQQIDHYEADQGNRKGNAGRGNFGDRKGVISGVGCLLATYCDPDGTNAYCSIGTLSSVCGHGRDRTREALQILELVGALRSWPGKGPRGTNVYELRRPVAAPLWGEWIHLLHTRRDQHREAAAMAALAALRLEYPDVPTAN